MKVLVVGGGGREHALVWKIAKSSLKPKIYAAPGNAGIENLAGTLPIEANDIDALLTFARNEKVDLTVVGPELPLELGIVDRFQKAGLNIFGPSRRAALLETSKVFAKEFMVRHGIPTADYQVFDSPARARQYIQDVGAPLVVKTDGLAAGKGAIVCRNMAQAEEAVELIMERRAFGPAGDRVVIEECMEGQEASILALVDGKNHLTLIPSQDHKPIYDGDQGPNTGGMGAYAPAPMVTTKLMAQVEQHILMPAVEGMAKEGTPFQGVLYAGLMITATGPRVVEFNCRFGDPEIQAVLPLLEDDILALMLAANEGRLREVQIRWTSGAAVCVVLASGGYPGPYQKGFEIHGLDQFSGDDAFVFHAGTRRKGRKVLTDGGRVLAVTALGGDVNEAVGRVYEVVGRISFAGVYFRKDIANRALGQNSRSNSNLSKRPSKPDPNSTGLGGGDLRQTI
jgi:phosphoribosylamine--glycine ligase